MELEGRSRRQWAKRNGPARITFGRDKRPELLALAMILGTTVKIEIRYPGRVTQGFSR